MNLPGGEKTRILQELDDDRRIGIAELNKTRRRMDLQRARARMFGTRNYIILKSLHLSESAKKGSLEIWTHLWSALVDIEVGSDARDPSFFKKAHDSLGAASKQLDGLEATMRAEMSPAE